MLKPRIITSLRKNFILPDSISYSAGNVTATIDGKLYSGVLPAFSVPTLNTLYFVYFVPGGTLVASTRPNSQGPEGYNSWVLVGAYYTNGDSNTPDFGTFVSIDGTPNTLGKVEYNALARTNLTLNWNSTSASWWRRGSQFGLITNFNGALTTSGSGSQIEFYLPTNLPQMPGDNVNNPQNNGGILGWCSSLSVGGSGQWYVTGAFRNGTDKFRFLRPASPGTASINDIALGAIMHFRVSEIALSEWTDEPLWKL